MNIEEKAIEVMGFISVSVINKKPNMGYDRLLEFVHEVLKMQRENCAKKYANKYGCDDSMSDVLIIENAPEPEWEVKQ